MFFSEKVSICLRQNLISKLLLSTSMRRGGRKGMKWDGEGTAAGAMVIFFPWHQASALCITSHGLSSWLPSEAQAVPGAAHSSLWGSELPKRHLQLLLLLMEFI